MADIFDSLENYLAMKEDFERFATPEVRDLLAAESKGLDLAIKILVTDRNEYFVSKFGDDWQAVLRLCPFLRRPDPEMAEILKSYGY